MWESLLIALVGELFKQFLDNLPALVAGLRQVETGTMSDAATSDSSGTVTELTHALDQAIADGAAPPP